ncbi:hypothetical protein [Pseudomonas chlororaphis]
MSKNLRRDDRQKGFYWVRHFGEGTVAEYVPENSCWFLPGDDRPVKDEELDFISTEVLLPPAGLFQ